MVYNVWGHWSILSEIRGLIWYDMIWCDTIWYGKMASEQKRANYQIYQKLWSLCECQRRINKILRHAGVDGTETLTFNFLSQFFAFVPWSPQHQEQLSPYVRLENNKKSKEHNECWLDTCYQPAAHREIKEIIMFQLFDWHVNYNNLFSFNTECKYSGTLSAPGFQYYIRSIDSLHCGNYW